ncbi:hypothetical protein [Flavobacterium sp. N3904]|uniref:hypothetical protein n=1 Tax=Flavobacterium sp. N3904 TaxID=2986835 RepID=UPI002225B2DE|nr:hypothetical protein [Flavobacterium sp. N3904]
MKRITLCLLLQILLISCKKDELSMDFKKVIIEYQNKVPLPEIKNSGDDTYLYVVNFEKKGNDTLFNLIRCPGVSKFDSISGIYQDETLKPLAILDKNKLGKSYYQMKRKDVNNFVVNNFSSREDFPPLYRYQIKNKKIVLIQIDTISDNWKR